MRLAFLYGSFSIGQRPFDFDALYTSPRGLTGSEISCVEYALAMKERGHEVLLVVGQPGLDREWRGIRVASLTSPRMVDGFDAVLSWNEPNLLREVAPGPLRVVNQQLNDFGYCRPGWEEWCDLVTSPSAHHLEYLKKHAPAVKSWAVLPNGCDPTQYRQTERIPGRVIWASSADRGLHRLLEVWPRIKRAVPHASLRAFYNFQKADFDDYESTGPNVHPDLLEIAQRKRYIEHAMSKLAGPKWDVEHVGSVSRERMRYEFERAQVLGYPCDTIRYTEGFSVTTLEACASGCLPVITDIDCLGSVYGAAAPTVRLRGGGFDAQRSLEFGDLVIEGLTNEAWRADYVAKCRALAAEYAWPVLAERLEGLIVDAKQSRKAA
jgi:glycosyltransferase involved in cell wall biosynthesis